MIRYKGQIQQITKIWVTEVKKFQIDPKENLKEENAIFMAYKTML